MPVFSLVFILEIIVSDRIVPETFIFGHQQSERESEFHIYGAFCIAVQGDSVSQRHACSVETSLFSDLSELERVCSCVCVCPYVVGSSGLGIDFPVGKYVFFKPLEECSFRSVGRISRLLVHRPPVFAEFGSYFRKVENHGRRIIVPGPPVVSGVEPNGCFPVRRCRKVKFHSDVRNGHQPFESIGAERESVY